MDSSTWIPVQPFPAEPSPQSFVSGDPAGNRLRIDYFREPGGDTIYARAWFGPGAEGPPGQAHGGAVAAVLDEAMGAAAWMRGLPVVAARIGISFLEMLPIGTDTVAAAWVERVEGRKVWTRTRLTDPAGRVVAEGEGLFIVLQPEALDALSRTSANRAG